MTKKQDDTKRIKKPRNAGKKGNIMTLKILCAGTLAAAAYSDIKTKRVPLWTVVLTACLGMVEAVLALTDGTRTLPELMLSMAPGILLLGLSVMSAHAVGAGDGLLLMSAGPVFGLTGIAVMLMIALGMSAVLSVVLLATKKADRKARIPFVPFLLAAMGVVLFAFP